MIQKENLIVKNDVDTQREEKKKEREREREKSLGFRT